MHPARIQGTLAVSIVVSDRSIPGARETVANLGYFFLNLVQCAPNTSVHSRIILPLDAPRQTVVSSIIDAIAALNQIRNPIFLFLAINGHSRLYRGEEATQHALMLGTQAFVAHDMSVERMSALQANGRDVLTATDIATILQYIQKVHIFRTILMLDTCHSMSLVSALACPPIDMRILHSTGEDEKTWQVAGFGSIMSRAWAQASSGVLENLVFARRQNAPKLVDTILSTAFWQMTQQAARIVSGQVLTTGPGQALRVL